MIMEITETRLKGVLLIFLKKYEDVRGYFLDTYHQQTFAKHNIPSFVQQSQSFSKKNVIRGLHFQKPPYAQAKLVRVLRGKILDVIVDMRKNSPTYGNHLALELAESDGVEVFIPEGFAHGFSVLSEDALVFYNLEKYYNPSSEGGIRYDDPDLTIDWKVSTPFLSEKDKQLPLFREVKHYF